MLDKKVQICEHYELTVFTPYNVGSVLRRLFNTAEAIQYCGGIASVLRGNSISTAGEASYCGGHSVLRGVSISTAGDSISTAGDSMSTVEG